MHPNALHPNAEPTSAWQLTAIAEQIGQSAQSLFLPVVGLGRLTNP
jgi:hypothetical protein